MKAHCILATIYMGCLSASPIEATIPLQEIFSPRVAYITGQAKQQQLRSNQALAKAWNQAILELDVATIRQIEKDNDWRPRADGDLPKMRQNRIDAQVKRGILKSTEQKEAFLNDPQNREIRRRYEEAQSSGDIVTLREIERSYQWIPIPTPDLPKADRQQQAAVQPTPQKPQQSSPQKLHVITDVNYARQTFMDNDERLIAFLNALKNAGIGNPQTKEAYRQFGYELPPQDFQASLYKFSLAITGFLTIESFDRQKRQIVEDKIRGYDFLGLKEFLSNQGFSPQQAEATSQYLRLISLLESFDKDIKPALMYARAYHSTNPEQTLKHLFDPAGINLTPSDIKLFLLVLDIQPDFQPAPPAQMKVAPAPTRQLSSPALFDTPNLKQPIRDTNFRSQLSDALIQDNRQEAESLLQKRALPKPTEDEYQAMRKLAMGHQGLERVETYPDLYKQRFKTYVKEDERTMAITALRDADNSRPFPEMSATWDFARLRQLNEQLKQDTNLRNLYDHDITNKKYDSLRQRIQENSGVRLNESEVKLFVLLYQQ